MTSIEPGFFLLDAWTDGRVEERCWIPAALLAGPEWAETRARSGLASAAIEYLRAADRYILEDLVANGLTLVWTGRKTWQQPIGFLLPDGLEYAIPGDDPCDECAATGADPQCPDDLCPDCYGTGKEHYISDEGCPWETAEPGAKRAIEFYEFETAEVGA